MNIFFPSKKAIEDEYGHPITLDEYTALQASVTDALQQNVWDEIDFLKNFKEV